MRAVKTTVEVIVYHTGPALGEDTLVDISTAVFDSLPADEVQRVSIGEVDDEVVEL